MKILAAGGGSGGHVTPVVAVLNELAKQVDLDEVQFICDKAFAVQARGIMSHAGTPVQLRVISAGKLRRYKHFRIWDYIIHPSVMGRNLVDIVKIGVGTLQSIKLLRAYKPDIIFLKGGYVCLPVGIAARLCHIPTVIHDSDARPGLTNRVLAPWAARIATGYPVENYPYARAKTTYTGVPINEKFTPVSSEAQSKYKKRLDLPSAMPLVVAIGGGLGAQSINMAMVDALPKLAGIGAHACIVAGKRNYDAVKEAAASHSNVTVYEFVSEGLVGLLSAADIVVTRASATTLQELAGLGKPIIAVPAKALSDQHVNAAVYSEANAAVVMSDEEIAHPDRLATEIVELLHDESRRTALAHSIHGFARPHAARDVAALLVETAQEARG